MKAIIYAGIGLFSAASVYGVADYYQTQKSGKLKNMYQENSAPAILPSERTIESEDYSRGKIEEPPQETVSTNDKMIAEKTTVKKKSPSYKKIVRTTKREERKISFKSFSRGRLIPKITQMDTALYIEEPKAEH